MKINRWSIGLVLAGLCSAVALTINEGPKTTPPPSPATETPVTHAPAAEAAWKKIQPHLATAERASNQAVARHCQRVRDFFAERRKRARAFAEASLSYGSKWAFAKSKLPFTDGDGHRKYLRERFEETVFSSAELEEVLQSAVKGCAAELQGIENDMLVKVRADLSDDALVALKDEVRFATEAALKKAYARAVENAAKTMAGDMPVWAGREAVTWVGADLTAPIIHSLAASLISRLGLSGGILSGGAASGAITLGAGIVAGIVIDVLLDRLLLALGYDPVADIEKQVIAAIQYCEALVLDGKASAGASQDHEAMRGKAMPDPQKPGVAKQAQGLYYQLSSLSRERAILRNAAIKKLVLEGGGK